MLGFHVLKNKMVEGRKTPLPRTYEQALKEEHEEYGIEAAQIFVSGPRSKRMIQMEPKKIKKTAKKLGIYLYAHNSYFGSPWSGSETQIAYVKQQLDACQKAGIKGFVIHLPKKELEVVIDILPKIVHPKVEILLEIPSAKSDPNLTWETPQRINKLCQAIRKNKIQNAFVCVDTSHIYACGYDISTKKQANKWLDSIKFPKMIHMIHLNDSAVPLGANKDVHAQIGKGHMYKGKKPINSGMAPFIDFAIDYEIPIILERAGLKNAGMDEEMEIMKKYFDLPIGD